MKTLTLQVPEALQIDNREATFLLAIKLYEKGRLSLGQAAEMTGYTKRTFMEILGSHNIPVFDYNPGEIATDIRNAGDYCI